MSSIFCYAVLISFSLFLVFAKPKESLEEQHPMKRQQGIQSEDTQGGNTPRKINKKSIKKAAKEMAKSLQFPFDPPEEERTDLSQISINGNLFDVGNNEERNILKMEKKILKELRKQNSHGSPNNLPQDQPKATVIRQKNGREIKLENATIVLDSKVYPNSQKQVIIMEEPQQEIIEEISEEQPIIIKQQEISNEEEAGCPEEDTSITVSRAPQTFIQEPPVLQAPPLVRALSVVQAPPAVQNPQVVQAPSAVQNPQVVQAPPAVQNPQVVQAPPAVQTPAVVQAPPVAQTPPVVQAPLPIQVTSAVTRPPPSVFMTRPPVFAPAPTIRPATKVIVVTQRPPVAFPNPTPLILKVTTPKVLFKPTTVFRSTIPPVLQKILDGTTMIPSILLPPWVPPNQQSAWLETIKQIDRKRKKNQPNTDNKDKEDNNSDENDDWSENITGNEFNDSGKYNNRNNEKDGSKDNCNCDKNNGGDDDDDDDDDDDNNNVIEKIPQPQETKNKNKDNENNTSSHFDTRKEEKQINYHQSYRAKHQSNLAPKEPPQSYKESIKEQPGDALMDEQEKTSIAKNNTHKINNEARNNNAKLNTLANSSKKTKAINKNKNKTHKHVPTYENYKKRKVINKVEHDSETLQPGFIKHFDIGNDIREAQIIITKSISKLVKHRRQKRVNRKREKKIKNKIQERINSALKKIGAKSKSKKLKTNKNVRHNKLKQREGQRKKSLQS